MNKQLRTPEERLLFAIFGYHIRKQPRETVFIITENFSANGKQLKSKLLNLMIKDIG